MGLGRRFGFYDVGIVVDMGGNVGGSGWVVGDGIE